jgi:hypothetical protein
MHSNPDTAAEPSTSAEWKADPNLELAQYRRVPDLTMEGVRALFPHVDGTLYVYPIPQHLVQPLSYSQLLDFMYRAKFRYPAHTVVWAQGFVNRVGGRFATYEAWLVKETLYFVDQDDHSFVATR